MTPAPIRTIAGLPFVAVTLRANGLSLRLENVLLDTGSGGSVFKLEDLKVIGVTPHPTDPLRFLSGVGGDEAVIEKSIDGIEVGDLVAAPFFIQMGAVDYGFTMDGILGFDFLAQTQAVIDLAALRIRAARS